MLGRTLSVNRTLSEMRATMERWIGICGHHNTGQSGTTLNV
jgi:hypothetical protein